MKNKGNPTSGYTTLPPLTDYQSYSDLSMEETIYLHKFYCTCTFYQQLFEHNHTCKKDL
jgi:hypothetical protein